MKQLPQSENTTTARGVSPVVGVVLLLAMIVVLVAVVSVFVFGLSPFGDAASTATTNVEVTENGYLVEVDDMGDMNSLTVQCDGHALEQIESTGQHTIDETGCEHLSVVGSSDEDEEVVTSMENVGHPEQSGAEPAELAVGGEIEMGGD